MFLWDTATIRLLMFWFNTHTYLGSTNWTQEVVVVISIIRRNGEKDMKVKRMCWEGSRESEVDMIKIHYTDVWNCERINKIYT